MIVSNFSYLRPSLTSLNTNAQRATNSRIRYFCGLTYENECFRMMRLRFNFFENEHPRHALSPIMENEDTSDARTHCDACLWTPQMRWLRV